MGHEKENLSGYLDGALAADERGRVEAHLQDCAGCRAELEALRSVSGMVKGLPQKALPAGFLQRLETRRRQEPASGGWDSLWAPRNVAWAACAVTVMLVTYRTVKLYAPAPAPMLAAAARPEPSESSAPSQNAVGGPVSTQDLVSLAKDQKRAEALAAVRGAAAGAAGSGADLSAPASPKSFGGMAIGEAPAAKPAYTNETLQDNLEAERARLGIRRIVFPNPVVRTLQATAHGLADDTGQSLSQEAIPAPVGGKSAALLSQPQGAGRAAGEGALVAPEDFSGDAADARSALRPRRSLGAPVSAAAPEAGQAVYSSEEMTLLWREQGFADSAPRVDFSQEILVAVFGRARIESVTAAANRIVVGYRVLDSAPLPRQRWRVIPRSELPVVFQPAGPDSSAPAPAASEAPQVPAGRNSSPPAP